jgi:hypothetical protein
MNGLIYHMAYQARAEDMRASATRHTARPPRRRFYRRAF